MVGKERVWGAQTIGWDQIEACVIVRGQELGARLKGVESQPGVLNRRLHDQL